MLSRSVRPILSSSIVAAVALALIPSAAAARPFIDRFSTVDNVASAVPTSGPTSGDQNPYGVAVVPRTTGALVRGDVLVSDFNDATNAQGTGATIMQVSPDGTASVFAVVPPPTSAGVTGLTTALVALRSGFVIVGNLPAPGGDPTMASAGALTVLNSDGQVVETIDPPDINGPWDMTALDHGTKVTLFVTNVLNGTVTAGLGGSASDGTVVRLGLSITDGQPPAVVSNTVIADDFTEELNSSALVVGPTGVGLGHDGTLYVADSVNNRIAAVPDALRRTTIQDGAALTVATGALSDPLGLAIAPNGDILTVDGNDGNLIETTPNGVQQTVTQLIANGGGDLFGLAIAPDNKGIYFVNDNTTPGTPQNSLELFH